MRRLKNHKLPCQLVFAKRNFWGLGKSNQRKVGGGGHFAGSDAYSASTKLKNPQGIYSKVFHSNGVKVGDDDLVESKTETLIDDARVSGDELGVVIEDVLDEHVVNCEENIDDARVSGDELGAVMENNLVNCEEKEGEFKVRDLVWGKVKSYPWWPGQIFDPSASTDKARKYSKKKGFLIAYFGDQSFAWNEASKIKPFRKNFVKMEKQSNTKSFCRAVDCALDEVSRRVECELACSCLSEEVYGKIRSQVFVNAGIRKDASRVEGGDNFSTVAIFEPANVVQSVQDLAREHFDGIDRLERSTVRAQLLAYFRWKGYHQFTTRDLFSGSDDEVEDKSEPSLVDKDKMVEAAKPASVGERSSSKKRKSDASDSVSRKHQHVRNDDATASKKGKCSSVANGENKKKGDSGKRKTVEGNGFKVENRKKDDSGKRKTVEGNGFKEENRKKDDSGKRKMVEGNGFKEENRKAVGDEKPSISSPKRLFRVGDSICRIAKQLSESPSILKKESQTSNVPSVHPPADEILSQDCLPAKDPMEENQILNSSAELSSEFRNSAVEKNSQLEEKNDEKCVDQMEEKIHGSEVAEAGEHKDTEGICPSVPDEQVCSDTNPRTSKENSATALILKFANLDSIPSPLWAVRETETEVMKKNNCAKVVFEAQSNAETAFSSAGKFSIFGPSLISYRLDYSPTLRKASATAKTQDSKDEAIENKPLAHYQIEELQTVFGITEKSKHAFTQKRNRNRSYLNEL
ncbi:hypothetical protein OSB04_009476 [Centaurea solstitialis]|uniref:PWWP domain-containing protein n=1 Tax=Centaurea solstitialis TaxID=347529 RepID=A0AA38TNR7_9ASTR|nr:hypothetical protein OSB04_009476 [Centaurea solstitialis]